MQRDKNNEVEREVVVMMTDMVRYSQITACMSPTEIRNFLVGYQSAIHEIVSEGDDEFPIDIEPSAGDGCLIIFGTLPDENIGHACDRAVRAAIKMSKNISEGTLSPTRIGMLVGDIVEVKIGDKVNMFGACFSVANRLEELCGYFGCNFLIDRLIAQKQTLYKDNLISIGKVSVSSMRHPMNLYSIYIEGIHNWPSDVPVEKLKTFINLKNSAMEFFGGNRNTGLLPHFPHVREELISAQVYYTNATGNEDKAIAQVLRYIGENPEPDEEFNVFGMRMMEKKRDAYGERIHHMSSGILKAFDKSAYHALLEDVSWEKHFKLEWRKKGDVIVEVGSEADGVYYLESGYLNVFDSQKKIIRQIAHGSVFGEVAHSTTARKRTATVIANTDAVLRRISSANLEKFPELKGIFSEIARKRLESEQQNENA
ncbi:MAG: cyclic nucleotide-binding domain-containing protein [Desulfotalea sp.]